MNAPKITLSDITGKIRATDYLHNGTLTICVLHLENGAKVTGTSACVSEANYDEAMGKRLAYDEAINNVWPLEGYLLRERIYQAGRPPAHAQD